MDEKEIIQTDEGFVDDLRAREKKILAQQPDGKELLEYIEEKEKQAEDEE